MVDKELPNVGNIHDDGWAKVFHELAAIVRASLCPMQADGRARRTIDNMLVRHQHYEVGTFARRSVIEEKPVPTPLPSSSSVSIRTVVKSRWFDASEK